MLLFTIQICFSLNTRTQARSEKIIVTKTHKDTPYIKAKQTRVLLQLITSLIFINDLLIKQWKPDRTI